MYRNKIVTQRICFILFVGLFCFLLPPLNIKAAVLTDSDNFLQDVATDSTRSSNKSYGTTEIITDLTETKRVNYVGRAQSVPPGITSERSAVKFDLSGITGTITSASFEFYVVDIMGNPVVNVIPTTDLAWNETDADPAFPVFNSGDALYNLVPITEEEKWKAFDVTNYIQSRIDGGANKVAFVLTGLEGEGDDDFCFICNQDSDTGLWAKLIIKYTPAAGAPIVTGTTPTNDTTPTWSWISGGGGDGNFRYKLDDGNLDSGAVSTTSTEFIPVSALSEGSHTLYVQESNGAGHWSSAGSHTITVDTIPPNPPTVTGTPLTNDTTPDWTWSPSGSGDGTYRYKLDNGDLTDGATITSSTGFTPSGALVEGSHTLYVQERDAAGNWSSSGSFELVVDITPPSAPVVTGTTPTSDATPTWTWSPGGGDGNGSYRYKLDSSDLTIGSTTTGSLSFTPVSLLPSGEHVLYVQESDAAGNWSSSGSFGITVDTQAPTVTLFSSATDPTNASPIPVTITFDEPVTGFDESDITVDNGTIVAGSFGGSGTAYMVNITPTADGAVTVNVAAGAVQDTVGNDNMAVSLRRTYDTQPPTGGTVSINGGAAYTNSTAVTLTLSATDAAQMMISEDSGFSGASYEAYAASKSFILSAGDGTKTVYVKYRDAAGNGAEAVNDTILLDTHTPVVSLSSTAPNPTNTSPIPVIITFDEAVTGFDEDDISVGNGTVESGSLVESGAAYTVNIIPAADGAVTVDIAANIAQDLAGNNNTAADRLSIIYDIVRPTVTLSSLAADPTNLSPVPVTITFSEAVTGFTESGITVGNGTVASGSLSGSGTTYTVNITPTADGAITVDVPADAAQDAAGNTNTAAAQLSRTYDTQPPTGGAISINGGAAYTTSTAVTLTLSATDAVQMIISENSNFSGASYEAYAAGKSFTLSLGDNVKTVYVKYRDAAGNETEAISDTITLDTLVPSVSLTTASPTNTSPIPVTITFSEDVTGFDITDILVGYGSKSNFSGSGAVYTVNIIPAADGVVTVDVGSGAAQDAVGHINTAADRLSITYDTQPPTGGTISINGGAAYTNSTAVTLTLSATGAAQMKISENIEFSDTDYESYTADRSFTLSSGDGDKTIYVKYKDAAGNEAASVSDTIRLDTHVPEVSLSSTAPDTTNLSPIPVVISFDEIVTGFDIDDISVVNGTKSDFSGSGDVYGVNITPLANGTVWVNVGTGAAQDLAGNNSTAALSLSRIYDTEPPTGASISINGGAAYATDAAVILTLSATGAYQMIISEDNSFSGVSYQAYDTGRSFTLSSGDGVKTVYVKYRDYVGNETATINDTITLDTQVPTVSLSSTAADPTNTSPIPVTITFSEAVTGFTESDISVSNGMVAPGSLTGSGTTYTVNIIPTANGAVTVDIAAGAAQDVAGNNNTAATQLSRTYDNVRPTVVLSSTAAASTNVSPVPVTITFSEPVTGFTESDISVGNGTVAPGSLVGSGTTYTVNIIPAADGAVTADVAAGAVQDAAGNTNTAADRLSRTYDTQPPAGGTVSINGGAAYASSASVTLTLSVTGAAQMMISEDSGFSGAGYEAYAADRSFTLSSGDGVKTVYVKYKDAAGNETAVISDTITLDTCAPTVSLSSTAADPTNASPVPVAITFSESITGFDESDISVGNGTVVSGSLVGSGAAYTVNIMPAADGTVTVDIAANTAQDLAGNSNTAAAQLSRTYDSVRPAVALSSTAADPTSVSPVPVTITFSEPVTGFTESDISVGNGTVASGSLSGSGAAYTANIIPAADGAVTVDVAAGAAQDAAGNTNTAAARLSITYVLLLNVTYYYNYDSLGVYITQEDIPYGSTLTEPAADPVRTGHIFAGWYREAGCVNRWNFASDTITGTTDLYAKWTAKTPVSIAETVQTVIYDGAEKAFAINGTPSAGFTITYNQGSGNVTPVNAGTYNVVLTRAEDATYASYSKTITGGLVINPAVISAAAVMGVTVPEKGAVPVTAITETAQYTGTVAWSPEDNPFAADTVYTATITLTPKSGYTLNGVAAGLFTVAGASASNAANSGVITAVFPATAPIINYTVTASSGSGGSISPSGAVSVTEGGSRTFTITPDSGYRISFVTVDGVNQGAITTYTFTNITANHTIIATFGRETPTTPSYNADVNEDDGSDSTLPVTVDENRGSAGVDVGSDSSLMSDGKTTVITVPSIPGADTYTLGIPVPNLSTADERGTLVFSTNTGSITVLSNMLTGVAGISGSKAEIAIGEGDRSNLPDDIKTAIGDKPLIRLTLSVDGRQTDWNNPNAPVKVTIPYTPTAEELAHPESIVVWYIDGSGKAMSVPNGRYDPAAGTVTFFTTHFSDYAITYLHKSFSDLDSAEWVEEAIEAMASKGIAYGTGEDTFSPDEGILRADYIAWLVKTLGLTAVFNGSFDDVMPDASYYEAAGIARKLEIVLDSGDNLFHPTDKISRQDMMVFAARALMLCQGLKPEDDNTALNKFSDKKEVSDYAAGSLAALAGEGLAISSGGKLKPRSYATRAEAAVFLYSIYNKYPNAPRVAASDTAAALPYPIAVPDDLKAASAGYNSVKLTWSPVAGATKYVVYRATSREGTYSKLTETALTSYTGTKLTTNTTYYYKVRACRLADGTKVYGDYSSVVSAKPVPAKASLKAVRASSTSVRLTWGKVEGSTGYEIYRATSSEGTYTKLTETASTSYTNTKLTTGKTYYYKVRAYRLVGKTKVYGSFSAVKYVKP
jgi:uncharacterized repeat protein (TIGR02543 family)